MANLNTYYYRVLLPHGGVRSGLLRLAVKRDLSARLRLEADTDGTVISLWRFPAWLAVVADALKRAHAHDVGVACLDVRVQLVELRVVRPAVVKVVDGLAPDGGGQARGRALAVQVRIIALQGKKIGHFFLYHAILSSR